MSEELFLIAHKVRGEPAFDIAVQMEVEDELWWIIPTSGHRAYPWWSALLANIDDTYELTFEPTSLEGPGSMPPALPDHYTTRASPAERAAEGQSLLAKLGLTRKPTTFTDRRV